MYNGVRCHHVYSFIQKSRMRLIQNPPVSSDKQAIGPHRWNGWMLVCLVILVGLVTTLLTAWAARRDAAANLRKDFDFHAMRIESLFKKRISDYGQVLHSVRGLYASSRKIDPHELTHFIAALHIRQHFPGVRDIGVNRLVTAQALSRHVAEMRRQGYPDYAIWPAGDRPLYAPIIQQELLKNPELRLIGRDQFSEPQRRAAMELARDTDTLAMTGPITGLTSDARNRAPYVMMFLPIYRKDSPGDTVQARRTHVTGWIYAPINLAHVFADMPVEITASLGVEIYDGESLAANTLLFDSCQPVLGTHSGTLDFKALRKIDFGGRTWTLLVHSVPAFEARLDTRTQYTILCVGGLLTVLVAWLTRLLATGRLRALALAEKLTADLKESESRFRAMADVAPAMIWMSNAKRKRLWVNQGWLDFIGAPNIDDFNRQWRDCIHPDDIQQYEAIRNDAHERQDAFTSEYRVRRHDGQYRWLMSTAIPRLGEQGEFLGLVGAALDITERKQTEEKLLQAALVYQNSSEAMLVADADPETGTITIVDVNPAFTSLTGYTPTEVIGQTTAILRSAEFDPNVSVAIRQSVEQDGRWQGEYRFRDKDGKPRLIWLNISGLFDAQGRIRGHISLMRDITQQKEAEETIHALTASLITAKEDEARRIASEMHDDLGQRLSWLRISLLMLPKLVQDKPTHLPESVERMKDAVDHVLGVVRDISANLRPATLDMGFLMAVEWQVGNFRTHTGIACVLDNHLEEEINLPDARATGAFRILQEALTNVSRYAQASSVSVTLRRKDNNLIMEIVDNGVGFDPGLQHKPRSIGLAGMRERTALLGGHLEIISAPGKGTTVRLTVPLEPNLD